MTSLLVMVPSTSEMTILLSLGLRRKGAKRSGAQTRRGKRDSVSFCVRATTVTLACSVGLCVRRPAELDRRIGRAQGGRLAGGRREGQGAPDEEMGLHKVLSISAAHKLDGVLPLHQPQALQRLALVGAGR